jgi:hypothetical protein
VKHLQRRRCVSIPRCGEQGRRQCATQEPVARTTQRLTMIKSPLG